MGLWQGDSLHSCAHCKTAGLQKQRGCPELGESHPGIIYQVGEEIFNHCLAGRVTPETLGWLHDFSYLEAGILPEAGGLNDQWEIDLQAFQVIANEKAALEKQKRGE